jgi:hypothetical protein
MPENEQRTFTEAERAIIELLQEEIERLVKELRMLQEEYGSDVRVLVEEGESDPIAGFQYTLSSLRQVLKEFLEYRDSERALRSLLALQLVSGQPETVILQLEALSLSPRFGGRIRQAASNIAHGFGQVFNYLKGAIQSISHKLWSLVSGYLKLKEWSIKGTVSTPAIVSLFGVTGSAEIQLTFEK